MKNLSRKSGAVLLFAIAVLAVSACSDDDQKFEPSVPNTGIGSIQASQVIAASPAVQLYYAEQYAFSFNEDGLLSSIRNVETGEVEVTYEYGSAPSTPSEQAQSTGALSAGKVLMTIRQTDTYVFQMLFSIGGNGYANSCVETNYVGYKTAWRFYYNADGQLVRLDDDGYETSFRYDAKGRMTSYFDHESRIEAKFYYNDALCTPYPKNDMEWISLLYYIDTGDVNDLVLTHRSNIQTSLGLFPAVSDFYYEDPEFIFAYLAGLVGNLSSALPSTGRVWDRNYTFIYLTEGDDVLGFKRREYYN